MMIHGWLQRTKSLKDLFGHCLYLIMNHLALRILCCLITTFLKANGSVYPKEAKEVKEVVIKNLTIPSWLDGYYIRQTCGATGEEKSSFVSHYFDCAGMLAVYKFQEGQVKYWSRSYPTRLIKDIREGAMYAGSKTFFSSIDPQRYKENQNLDDGLLDTNPNLGLSIQKNTILTYSFWPQVYAMSYADGYENLSPKLVPTKEPLVGVKMVHDLVQKATDKHGTTWSTSLGFSISKDGLGIDLIRSIYKIDANNLEKQIVGSIRSETLTKRNCIKSRPRRSKWAYTGNQVEGYVHNIAVTERYVIVPMTRGSFNPCNLMMNPYEYGISPFIENIQLKITDPVFEIGIMTKANSKMQFFDIKQPEQTLTQIINAYESSDGQQITVDTAVYDAEDYFLYYQLMNFLINKDDCPAVQLKRYVINLKDSTILQFPLMDKEEEFHIDHIQVNPNYTNDKKYRFIYAVETPYDTESSVLKMSLQTGQIAKQWKPDDKKMSVNEISFVPRPEAKSEDDGAIIVSATKKFSQKGYIFMLDAESFEQIGRVEIPEIGALGFRGQFVYSSAKRPYGLFRECVIIICFVVYIFLQQ